MTLFRRKPKRNYDSISITDHETRLLDAMPPIPRDVRCANADLGLPEVLELPGVRLARMVAEADPMDVRGFETVGEFGIRVVLRVRRDQR